MICEGKRHREREDERDTHTHRRHEFGAQHFCVGNTKEIRKKEWIAHKQTKKDHTHAIDGQEARVCERERNASACEHTPLFYFRCQYLLFVLFSQPLM